MGLLSENEKSANRAAAQVMRVTMLVFAAVLLKMRTNAFSGMFSRHYSSPGKIKSLPLLYKIPKL